VLGRLIGYNDWNLAQAYFNPTPDRSLDAHWTEPSIARTPDGIRAFWRMARRRVEVGD
jgi:hypothetical protein